MFQDWPAVQTSLLQEICRGNPLCSALKHYCSQTLSSFTLHTRNMMMERFLWLCGFSVLKSKTPLGVFLGYLTLLGHHNYCAVCSNKQRTLYILNLVCPGDIPSAFCCKSFQCFLLQIRACFLPWTLLITAKMPDSHQWKLKVLILSKSSEGNRDLSEQSVFAQKQNTCCLVSRGYLNNVCRKSVSVLVNTDVTIKLFCWMHLASKEESYPLYLLHSKKPEMLLPFFKNKMEINLNLLKYLFLMKCYTDLSSR